MEITKSPKLVAIGAGVASFAAILGGGAIVHAQGASAQGNVSGYVAQTNPGQPTQATPPSAADRQAEMDAYLQKLAANLGIDVTKLTDALKQTAKDRVAADLAAGKITQAQADAANTRIDSGDFLFGPMGGRHGGPGGEGRHGGRMDEAALTSFLGIDQATLRTERQAGKSLATIASDHGKSRDELKAFLTDQEKTEVAAAVTNGAMTQAQADAHLQQFTANLDKMIDSTGGPHGMGGHGPRGGQDGAPSGTTTAPATQG